LLGVQAVADEAGEINLSAAGVFLSQNIGLAAALLLPFFPVPAFATWRLLDTNENDRR